ncbi:MAG: NAD(+) kinase, partial [Sphingobium sp.]
MNPWPKRALVASPTQAARAAEERLRGAYDFTSLADADMVIALGGDGFMLQTLHSMLEAHRILPIFGMNLGTV